MLTENAEDLSVSDLVSQSSKLRVLLAKLHEIRTRRAKVIVFARLRTMQGILAKVLQAEFEIPDRIINGETKLRAPGSLNASGQHHDHEDVLAAYGDRAPCPNAPASLIRTLPLERLPWDFLNPIRL
jgi:hypothetical protein